MPDDNKRLNLRGLEYFWEKIRQHSQGVKYGTTAYWNDRRDYIPERGTIVVYSDYAQETIDGNLVDIPNIKVGDGLAYLIDLPFIEDDLRKIVDEHIDDDVIHITQQERLFWNNKVRVDPNDLSNENLILTTL